MVIWTVLGVVLLVVGLVTMVYSSWFQDSLRQRLVQKINSEPGVELRLGRFDLSFPLKLDIADLLYVQNGDTLVEAAAVQADVKLLPLIAGKVEVDRAFLANAKYNMGNADSLMQMRISADTILLQPATVGLASLDINLISGSLAHGSVTMISRPDTVAAPAAPADSAQEMKIRVGSLNMRDFTYIMRMLPTIDSLGTHIDTAILSGGLIDMKQQLVNIHAFAGTGLNAAYIAPDSAAIAATPVAPASETASAPWTVRIDSIHFSESQGLYTTRGVQPLPGLDFAYIQADSMDITVTNFYNRATDISLPIALTATERCGLTLTATGTYAMDSAAMRFDAFHVVTTTGTDLSASGMLGVGDMTTDPDLPMRLAAVGDVSIPDLRTMFPAFSAYLAPLPQKMPISLKADVDGTAGDLNIADLSVSVNHVATLNAKGQIRQMFSASGPQGNLSFNGNIIDVNSIVRDMAKGTSLTVPPMTLYGSAVIRGDIINADLKARTLGGSLALNATYAQKAEGYDIHLVTDKFPVQAFMPDMGVGNASIDLTASGAGFDPFAKATHMDAHAKINSLTYNKFDYTGITADVAIADGRADLDVRAYNPALDATIHAAGNLDGETYDWDMDVDAPHVDLQAMNMSETPAVVELSMTGNAAITPASNALTANVKLKEMTFTHQTGKLEIDAILARLSASDSLTTASITNRDLLMLASLPCNLDTISARFAQAMGAIDIQMSQHRLNADSLQRLLPQFNVYASAGPNNVLNDILGQSNMSMRSLRLSAINDSALSLRSQVLGIRSSSMLIDTIGLKISQDGESVNMIAKMDNRPGNLDNFAHVRLDAIASNQRLVLRATQQNLQGQTGFDFGSIAVMADSSVTMRLFPLNPTIGYKKWSVNLDNYITYTLPTKKIDANINMRGDKSAVRLYTVTDSLNPAINDIALQLTDIHIADWIAFNPWAPPITGDINADIKVRWAGTDEINGNGTLSLVDFNYGKERVGNFRTNFDVATNASGSIHANADLFVNDAKTLTLSGILNDSTATSPFALNASLISFPLSVANPFLPEGTASLIGTLNGNMRVSGDSDQPVINGELFFDAAAVKLAMTGTDYKFSEVKIPVKDNLVTLADFGISGANSNPLLINGTVDIANLANPKINLDFRAKNMMLVNTSKAVRGANIYGKAYIDLTAAAKGNMDFLDVTAALNLLPGTNITYELTDATTMLEASQQKNDMVKFVNFSDTTAVAVADSIAPSGMLMMLDATLTIQNGVTITADLSATTRDKVEIQPQGSVNYTMSPLSDGRLTGRINFNGGMARYTLPIVGGEKKFDINEGSYVAFNGNMLNPVLNLHATDQVKSNVTIQGQNSRLVVFNILLSVTGTLENMNVAFDLSTKDDITVANEIQGMTAEQRANQAMNLLLYNMYTGPGTKSSMGGTNPLFSFLESKVNNWAANNIKGVDVSFGIDQYDQTTNGSTSQTTSYSYQVSKTLFNDRFKVVVGGNYSTDDNSEENLSQNLINDISFEYYLNKKRNMLIRLFRHTGYESILEGEITQTGVGFVYKKRISRLSDMLPRFMRPKKKL